MPTIRERFEELQAYDAFPHVVSWIDRKAVLALADQIDAELATMRDALARIGTDHCYSGDDEECPKILDVEDYCARCLALRALGSATK